MRYSCLLRLAKPIVPSPVSGEGQDGGSLEAAHPRFAPISIFPLKEEEVLVAAIRALHGSLSSGWRRPPCPASTYAATPWHRLYFLPLPHGHWLLRPTLAPPGAAR